MPQYEFTCRVCGQYQIHEQREPVPDCASCGQPLKRVYSVNVQSQMEPHFNFAAGRYVTSAKDLEMAAHEIAVRNSERFKTDLGEVHVVGPSEKSALGVTDEIPDAVKEKWAKQKAGDLAPDPALKEMTR